MSRKEGKSLGKVLNGMAYYGFETTFIPYLFDMRVFLLCTCGASSLITFTILKAISTHAA